MTKAARLRIQASFRIQGTQDQILRPSDVALTFRKNRHHWNLPGGVNEANIIEFLIEEAGLRDVSLVTTSEYPSIRRYTWASVSPYQVALTARPDAYLSHGTALALHQLSTSPPMTIYVNQEQSPKLVPRAALTQDGIDRAFSNRQRLSTYTLKYDAFGIVLLSGKNTGRFGVKEVSGPAGERVPTTDVERTLVDVVVRPAYAGGVTNVAHAFELARSMLSVDRLVVMLKKLGHAYPYHQAIGFCMERAGLPERALRKLERLGIELNFYLAHDMREARYSKRWKIFYPRSL